MELLSGLVAGKFEKNKKFPANSVNSRVEKCLTLFAKNKENGEKTKKLQKHI